MFKFLKKKCNNVYFNERDRLIQIRDKRDGNWYMIDRNFVVKEYASIINEERKLPIGYDMYKCPVSWIFYFPYELTKYGYLNKMKLEKQDKWPISVQTWDC